ncbi:INO80 complex subunit C-like [Saccoglossus kowalevskii]|uniref:INO80 complex subunit C-like n=1 Tax=Saccoglossus kowalevskii TaxID=10224 RepID=A0ABM0GUI6_SACKO|nr:PREDICTED: INO80 complex subunit C-like [Saccoglossus kowalevskii]
MATPSPKPSRQRRSGKRPGSPGSASLSGKRKRNTITPCSSTPDLESLDSVSRSSSPAVSDNQKVFPFKDATFVHSGNATSGKKRIWRNAKQIISAERSLPWHPNDPTYSSIDAPPSFKPAKKYSDLSGLAARYTDPHTKIRYANTDEFSRIRMLPMDIVSGYLALRKANTPVP